MFDIFKRKKKEILEPAVLSSISIITKHKTYSWTHDLNHKSEYLLPWRKFIKWYYSRPQSDFFDFYDKRGFTSLRREDIVSFRVMWS